MESAEYALMDEAEDRMWWYRALHARMIAALEGVEGRVLDAGCGTGGLLAALRRSRPDLWLAGLEWSDAASRRAASKSGVPLVRGTVNSLPYASSSFDAALAADVLCHGAVEPALGLGELRRVVRPGGRLIVNMPAYGWLLSTHDRRVHNTRRQTARQLKAMLVEAGFSPLRICYWNGLLLPLMVAQRKLRPRRHDSASDVAAFPPWLDFMLHRVTELERRLPLSMPAGGSVLAQAIRR
jgi:SAM-dependent methyltransferase